MPYELRTQVGPGNHVLDGGPDIPWEVAIFWGKGASYCKVSGYSTVTCAKTVEPIEMLFGLWAQMGPRNHVLDGGPVLLRDVAMVTNFRLSLGYNFLV